MLLVLLPALGGNPVCDIYNASRVWWTTGDCVVQGQTIDLARPVAQGLSVVNLFGEIGRNPDGKYRAVQFKDAGLWNGTVNVDLNLTLTEKDTDASVFGLQNASFANVTVHGTITVRVGCVGNMTLNLKLFDQGQDDAEAVSNPIAVVFNDDKCCENVSTKGQTERISAQPWRLGGFDDPEPEEVCRSQHLDPSMDTRIF